MRAGRLRHYVELQRVSVAADSHGDQSKTWSTIATAWAQVLEMTMRERQSASQTLADADVRVLMRGRSDLRLTPKDRVKFGDRIFDIRGVVDMGGKGIEWQLLCTERF
jgi:SPP1 family predicted phage head-tail adaptor